MRSFTKAVVSLPGQARRGKTPFGARIDIHATAAQTDGAFGMWETFTPPGQGPAPHTHTREAEIFRVVRGVYRFTCGDEEFDAPAGSVVTLPPHVRHSWRNISDEPGEMFVIVVPGGFEQLFADIETSGAATPEDIAVIEARFGLVNDAVTALGRKEPS